MGPSFVRFRDEIDDLLSHVASLFTGVFQQNRAPDVDPTLFPNCRALKKLVMKALGYRFRAVCYKLCTKHDRVDSWE